MITFEKMINNSILAGLMFMTPVLIVAIAGIYLSLTTGLTQTQNELIGVVTTVFGGLGITFIIFATVLVVVTGGKD